MDWRSEVAEIYELKNSVSFKSDDWPKPPNRCTAERQTLPAAKGNDRLRRLGGQRSPRTTSIWGKQ